MKSRYEKHPELRRHSVSGSGFHCFLFFPIKKKDLKNTREGKGEVNVF